MDDASARTQRRRRRARADADQRAGVVAFLAAHVLHGYALESLQLADAVPLTIGVEADEDVRCALPAGGTAVFQITSRLSTRVLARWRALAERPLDPERDRVVAVCAEASSEVRALATALHEGDGAPSKRAFARIEDALGGLSRARREALLRCATIWVADLRDDSGVEADEGELLLGTAVVPPGVGVDAWRALRSLDGRLRRRRHPHDAAALLVALREHGVPLREDREQLAVARLDERRRACARYLAQLAHPRSALADVAFASADGLTLMDASALAGALRDLGHVAITGPPGAGKSAALKRVAAAYASDGGPLPMLVESDTLNGDVPALDAALACALRAVPPADRNLIAEVVGERLDRGTLAVLLDGSGSTAGQLARTLDPRTQVVLATRSPSDAPPRFAVIHTLPPARPELTVQAVLRAQARGRQGDEWVRERADWAAARLRRTGPRPVTPLLAVAAALAAAEATSAARMPATPAGMLAALRKHRADRLSALDELDAAARLTAVPETDQRAAISTWIADPSKHETLVLAASLTGQVATALVDACIAASDPDAVVLAARAVTEGADVEPNARDALAWALLRALFVEEWTTARERVAVAVAEFPLPEALHRKARDAFRRALEPPESIAINGLATASWRETGAEANARLLAVIRRAPETPQPVGGLWPRCTIAASARLIALGDTERVGQLLGRVAPHLDRELRALLSTRIDAEGSHPPLARGRPAATGAARPPVGLDRERL
jgi:hypothetical protein